MSKEAQFALSIATVRPCSPSPPLTWQFQLSADAFCVQEEFIKRFTRAGHLLASSEKRSIVSYRDMGTSHPTFPALPLLLNHIPNSDRGPKSTSKVSRRCLLVLLIRPYSRSA